MEFSEKGTMDPKNGHFSPINGLECVNGIQFSLCGTPTNLIFAHRVLNYYDQYLILSESYILQWGKLSEAFYLYWS